MDPLPFLKGVRAEQNVADNHSKSARICRYPRGSRANVNIIVRKNGSARIRSLPGLVRSEPFLAVTQMLTILGSLKKQDVADNHSKSARICRYPRGSRTIVIIFVRKNRSARVRSLPGWVRSEPILAVTQMLTILSNLKKPLGS